MRWHTTKNNTTFREAYERENCICRDPWRSFWRALDEVCEGNIVYDFYWWFIWSPVRKVLGLPKEFISKLKFNRQRIKYSIAEEDVWGWSDNILDYFSRGFDILVRENYGKDVERWTSKEWRERNNWTWNKERYDKICNFQDCLIRRSLAIEQREKYLAAICAENALETNWTPERQAEYTRLKDLETEAERQAWECLAFILKEYHWELWT